MSENFITPTMHFTRKGKKNTEALLGHAAARAAEAGVKKVIIATCTGATAKMALEHFDPAQYELIAVSHVTGFGEANRQELPEEARAELEAAGYRVLTAAHAFGSVGRGVRNKLNTFQVDEIMAFTLRMFGQGVKVGVEMGLMVADRGWVRTDEDVMTIAGSARGADTALILQPANSHTCLETKVREIVAKPHQP